MLRSSLEREFDKTNFISPKRTPSKSPHRLGLSLQGCGISMPKIRKGCIESPTRPCCLLQINIDKKCTANCLLLGNNFFVPGHVLFQVCDISNILLIMYSLDKKRDNILLVSTRVFPYWEVEVVRGYYIMQG